MAAVCVLPYFLIEEFGVDFYFGGTGLLIIVIVGIDTLDDIENHLVTRHYEGFGGGPGGGDGGGPAGGGGGGAIAGRGDGEQTPDFDDGDLDFEPGDPDFGDDDRN